MDSTRGLEFIKSLVENGEKISKELYLFLRTKENLIKQFNLNYGDLLLLNHILSEKEVVFYYNEYFKEQYKEILNIVINSELKDLYEELGTDLIPLEYNRITKSIVVTGIEENPVSKLREIQIKNGFINIEYKKSFKVAYLILKLEFTDQEDSLLKTFSPQDKAKVILMDAINNKATDIHLVSHYNSAIATYEYKVGFRVATDMEEWNRFKLTKSDNEQIIINFINMSREGSVTAIDTISGVEDSIPDIIGDGSHFARLSASKCLGGYHSVLRLHEVGKTAMQITELGFGSEVERKLKRLARVETGSLWVTGKPGSGKNTTIYSLLKEVLDTGNLNVSEYSNPVEVLLPCTQKEFKSSDDLLTLIAKSKKEDPDVIFVGEIPNKPIAIGVKELIDSNIRVLTTTHLERAWNIPQKLFDYYGEDYKNVLSSMNAVVTQTMFKKVCEFCRKEIQHPTLEELEYISYLGVKRAFKVNKDGCEVCNKRGYSLEIFPQAEILEFNDSLVSNLLEIRSPIEMEIYLKKYCIANKLNIEYSIRPLVEEGLVDIEQIKRRGLCK